MLTHRSAWPFYSYRRGRGTRRSRGDVAEAVGPWGRADTPSAAGGGRRAGPHRHHHRHRHHQRRQRQPHASRGQGCLRHPHHSKDCLLSWLFFLFPCSYFFFIFSLFSSIYLNISFPAPRFLLLSPRKGFALYFSYWNGSGASTGVLSSAPEEGSSFYLRISLTFSPCFISRAVLDSYSRVHNHVELSHYLYSHLPLTCPPVTQRRATIANTLSLPLIYLTAPLTAAASSPGRMEGCSLNPVFPHSSWSDSTRPTSSLPLRAKHYKYKANIPLP